MTFAVDSKGVATLAPNKQVLTEWVEALESGEFGQVDGALRNDNGYCCLGVLCEIAARKGVVEPAVAIMTTPYFDDSESLPTGDYSYAGNEAYLPAAVASWAFGKDLSGYNPKLNFDGDEHPASGLNDALHLSFSEIAEAIRETFDL